MSSAPDVTPMAFDELLATSDVVSLHVPLTPETHHLIDQRALARMKRSAYLVNTSRGPVVDEAALVWALTDRLIAGAALDVYEHEPVVHPGLLGARERRAGTTSRKRHAGNAHGDGELAVRNVASVLQGRGPVTPVSDSAQSSSPLRRPPDAKVGRIMRILARQIDGLELPAVEKIAEGRKENAFQVLIARSCRRERRMRPRSRRRSGSSRRHGHRARWRGCRSGRSNASSIR